MNTLCGDLIQMATGYSRRGQNGGMGPLRNVVRGAGIPCYPPKHPRPYRARNAAPVAAPASLNGTHHVEPQVSKVPCLNRHTHRPPVEDAVSEAPGLTGLSRTGEWLPATSGPRGLDHYFLFHGRRPGHTKLTPRRICGVAGCMTVETFQRLQPGTGGPADTGRAGEPDEKSGAAWMMLRVCVC